MPRQVDFKVPKINCEDGDEVPYTDCEEAEKIQMITKMTCEVKHTTDCKPVVSTKCGNVQYQVGYIKDIESFWTEGYAGQIPNSGHELAIYVQWL